MNFNTQTTAISAVLLLAASSLSYAAEPMQEDQGAIAGNAEHADAGLKLKSISPL